MNLNNNNNNNKKTTADVCIIRLLPICATKEVQVLKFLGPQGPQARLSNQNWERQQAWRSFPVSRVPFGVYDLSSGWTTMADEDIAESWEDWEDSGVR